MELHSSVAKGLVSHLERRHCAVVAHRGAVDCFRVSDGRGDGFCIIGEEVVEVSIVPSS